MTFVLGGHHSYQRDITIYRVVRAETIRTSFSLLWNWTKGTLSESWAPWDLYVYGNEIFFIAKTKYRVQQVNLMQN